MNKPLKDSPEIAHSDASDATLHAEQEWDNCAWKLDVWQIEPAINCVEKEGQLLPIEPRLMTALMVLIGAEGKIVSDKQLMQAVWPKVIVSDASLYQVIAQLRKIFSDQQKPYKLIERVNKKGYRLLKPAIKIAAKTNVVNSQKATNPALLPAMRRNFLLTILCGFVIVIGGASLWQPKSDGTAAANDTVSVDTNRLLADDQDWLLQASYLINQPNAEAVERGVLHLEQHSSLAKQSPTFLVTLCNGYLAMHTYGDWPIDKVLARCEPLLQGALAEQIDFAPALASFGAIQLSRGNLPAAQYYLEKAIQLVPDDIRTMLWRAELYRTQGNIPQALTLLTTAQQLAPLSGLVKRNMAYALLDNGQFSLARDQFKQALLIDSHYSDRPLDELEFLPLTTHRARAFLSWSQRYPDRLSSPERVVHLSLVQLSLQQIELATSTLQTAVKIAPDNLFVLLAQAMLAHAQGHNEQALFYLTKRAKLAPTHKLMQLQALLLIKDESNERQYEAIRHWLPDYFETPETAVKRDLSSNQPLNVLYFLLSLSEQQRMQYQPLVKQFVAGQQEVDSISLQLLSAVGHTAQAELLALEMLEKGWLPSPHDDFYLPENHPLWLGFSDKFYEQLSLNREDLVSQLSHFFPE